MKFTGTELSVPVFFRAFTKSLPCVGVSTLRAMAENFKGRNCIVCAVMDARCNQVYNALFEIEDNQIKRLCDDRALLCDELAVEIKNLSQNKKEDRQRENAV